MTDGEQNKKVDYWDCKYHPNKGLILECVHIYTENIVFDGEFTKEDNEKYIVDSGSGVMYIDDTVLQDLKDILSEIDAEHILNSDGSISLQRLEFMSEDMVYFSINGGKAISNTTIYEGLVNKTALQIIENMNEEEKEYILNKAGI